jgi:hypothetical protein
MSSTIALKKASLALATLAATLALIACGGSSTHNPGTGKAADNLNGDQGQGGGGAAGGEPNNDPPGCAGANPGNSGNGNGGGGGDPSGGTISNTNDGGAGFEFCDRSLCPATLPAIGATCPPGSSGPEYECLKVNGVCTWQPFCGL